MRSPASPVCMCAWCPMLPLILSSAWHLSGLEILVFWGSHRPMNTLGTLPLGTPPPVPHFSHLCFPRCCDYLAPAGGSLYFEAHLMFDKSELSKLQADVVIAPVVEQKLAAYTLVAGGWVERCFFVCYPFVRRAFVAHAHGHDYSTLKCGRREGMYVMMFISELAFFFFVCFSILFFCFCFCFQRWMKAEWRLDEWPIVNVTISWLMKMGNTPLVTVSTLWFVSAWLNCWNIYFPSSIKRKDKPNNYGLQNMITRPLPSHLLIRLCW